MALHKATLAVLISGLILLSSCSTSTTSPDVLIGGAEYAIAAGDRNTARALTEPLMDGNRLKGLSATQLGRLSIIEMQLADSLQNPDDLSRATTCYTMAFSVDPDSASDFFENVSADAIQYVALMRTLTSPPSDSIADEEPDSLVYFVGTDNTYDE